LFDYVLIIVHDNEKTLAPVTLISLAQGCSACLVISV